MLKALFIHDFKFLLYKNKAYGDGQFEYENLWKKKYLSIFGLVTIIARGIDTNKREDIKDKFLINGKDVSILATPSLASIKGIIKIKTVREQIEKEILNHDVVFVRLPSTQGLVACSVLEKHNVPYIIELVGNAFDALWYHGGIFGKLSAPVLHYFTKKHIKRSKNVMYVTNISLQKVYPNKNNTIACSDVVINEDVDDVFSKRIRRIKKNDLNLDIKIGLVGSYDVAYKGHDTAIKALSRIDNNSKLHLLGSGNSEKWKNFASKYGVQKNVFFDAPVNSGKAMQQWLASLDILLMPSMTEGMPRVLIEAMNIGLPIVATNVGEIKYLIDKENVVQKGDWHSLADRINYMINNKDSLISSATNNFNKSKQFGHSILKERRITYINNILVVEKNNSLKKVNK